MATVMGSNNFGGTGTMGGTGGLKQTDPMLREKRSFKDKLHSMVQEAEEAEQEALREAQLQDRKSLSISMLLEGRPAAFVDFFQVTHPSTSSSSGPAEAELPQEALLLLKAQLVKADAASREGKWMEVFNAYKVLAKYFAQLGRLGHAERYFLRALKLAQENKWVQGELEANLALGVVYEEMQDVKSAVACHERRLVVACENMLEEDMAGAYKSLTNVYLGQAEKEEKAGQSAAALVSYSKCLSASERAGNAPVAAKAHYRMGMIHFEEQRWPDATFHLRRFCEDGAAALGDKVAEGVAHTSLAQCLREVKDTEGSIALLEHYLDTTQRAQDRNGPAMACCSLGTIYLEKGEHLKAVTFFEKFFEIARTLGDRKVLDAARFNLGVAKGAMRMAQYMELVNTDLPKLIQWKNVRADF